MERTSDRSERLRLSGVSFLNAQPVLHGLLAGMGHERMRLQLAEPSELARQLFEGDVDAALAPVAPLATHGDLEVVPDVAIGCDGPVRSVVIVGEQPIETLYEVMLDAASRTSVVLARILLRELRGGSEPRYFARPASEIVDAVSGSRGGLLIGDPALEAEGRFPYVLDLGAAWKQLTGLPFVFAVWIARRGVLDADDCRVLRESLALGLAERADIAAAWQRGRGGEAEEHQRYLTENIRYDLDERAIAGMREFLRRAAEARLLPLANVAFVSSSRQLETGPRKQTVARLLEDAQDGKRLSLAEAQRLYAEADLEGLSQAAAHRSALLRPRGVQAQTAHVTHSNVCQAGCGYCRVAVHERDAAAFTRSREELVAEVSAFADRGITRVVLDGGLHPRLHLEWFESLFATLRDAVPQVAIHGLSPDEVVALARKDDLSLAAVVQRLADAGLDAIWGGGAEVLTDRVRSLIAPQKCDSRTWLEVMRLSHRAGMRTLSTMMFGTVDDIIDRILHLIKLRDLQDETGGFDAFIPYAVRGGRPVLEADYLRLIAISRLLLDNIAGVQVAAVDASEGLAALAMQSGADGVFGPVSGALARLEPGLRGSQLSALTG